MADGGPAPVLLAHGLAEDQADFAFDGTSDLQLDKRETLEFVRAYNRILDPAVRKRLFELAKALANLYDSPRDSAY
jgi:hypothetical protein